MKNFTKTFYFVFMILAGSSPVSVFGASETGEESFETGYSLYETGNYKEAIAFLEEAVQKSPDNAIYHHTLARSYGREAERTNWFKAMEYARKTREHLELALKLDANNLQILDDLMDYYREAPAFLGGDNRKAVEIQARIQRIKQADHMDMYSMKAGKTDSF